jgi:hypothetical protein
MATATTVGCSGTPLAKKLGIGAGCQVLLLEPPAGYRALLEPLPADVGFAVRASSRIDLVQVFVTRREDLARRLVALRTALRPEAAVWVSWPKKASGVPSTVTEDVVREIALPLGFVDTKVCAVDDVWSGLKLVVRRALRPA